MRTSYIKVARRFLDVRKIITWRNVRVLEPDIDAYRSAREFIVRSPRILTGFVRDNISYLLLSLSIFAEGAGLWYIPCNDGNRFCSGARSY